MRQRALVALIMALAIVGGGIAGGGAVAGASLETDNEAPWRAYAVNDTFDIDPADGLTEAEIERVVDRAMVRVEYLRGVSFTERPDVEVISREAFQQERSGDRTMSTDSQRFLDVKMQGLFFVDQTTAGADARQSTRNVSTGGYYLIGQNEIVVIYDGEAPVLDEITLAHELVHAWQDQRFDLRGFGGESLDADRALLGLIEGDAVYLELQYAEKCEEEWDCVIPEDPDTSNGSGSDADFNWGVFFADFQPYSDGPRYIEAVYAEGGWEAVDALYEDPPTTTRHVINVERDSEFDPRTVELEDTHGEGWDRLIPSNERPYEQLGQARIAAMFLQTPWLALDRQEYRYTDRMVNLTEAINYEPDGSVPRFNPINYDIQYADGWAGDRFHAYYKGEKLAWVWRITWDTPDDARVFVDGYAGLLTFFGGEPVDDGLYQIDTDAYHGVYAVVKDGETVTLAYAPSEADLPHVSAEVAAAIGINASEPTDSIDRGTNPSDRPVGPHPPASSAPTKATGADDAPNATRTMADEPDPMPGFTAALAVLSLGLAGAALRGLRRTQRDG